MGSYSKKSYSASTWLTQTQLGNYFDLSEREIGQYLIELGLRVYDSFVHEYLPTEDARVRGLCALMAVPDGEAHYLWHRQNVLALLQEQLLLIPLSGPDRLARLTALDLIEVEKDAGQGDDKAYYQLFDSISAKRRPLVMAWALFIVHRSADPIYARLLTGTAETDVPAINVELARLKAGFSLDIKLLSD